MPVGLSPRILDSVKLTVEQVDTFQPYQINVIDINSSCLLCFVFLLKKAVSLVVPCNIAVSTFFTSKYFTCLEITLAEEESYVFLLVPIPDLS